MKKWSSLTASIISLISVAAFLFILRDVPWPCGIKLSVGSIKQDKYSRHILNTIIETPGALLSSNVMGIQGPAFAINVYGNGDYLFRYSGNVSRIALWLEQTKVYDGPPIIALNVGKGTLGIDLDAEGSATVEAYNQCTIHRAMEGFFN